MINFMRQERQPANKRYHIVVTKQVRHAAAIRVFDQLSGSVLIEWRGAVVLHLLESGVLPSRVLRNVS